ncbi:hypothetical protein Rwratislav_37857 [Rhodococcus wratislaviensis IFP 2016]|uniref:YbaB/EbfC DNA-binding family protein n=2 Tax=Rhodococcus opacus TaxID=37919 RepID=A0A1B1K3X7_RHOOP|nr:hypothetical protein R1CP_12700 [Rhodococcus opacus]ELB87823.1 hypothetical protein Rwratislav_37857 [Rhodococcus wratislaviensis IFP 2016]CAG7608103.1 hypothetical protein E143388_05665 [Rhodococcus opacus]
MTGIMFPPTPPPAGTTAAVSNRSGTVSVRTTEQGLPLELRIDPRELRYGGQRLADEILTLCRRSAMEAGARRRDELARDGMPAEILDKLGLPTRADVATAQAIEDEEEPTPTTWMRPL